MAYIKLNSKNYFYNLDLISDKAGGKEKVFVVLKDNAYGHGLKEMASLASAYGIKRAVVKNLKEATQIKNLFEEILILSEILREKPDENISVTANSIDSLFLLPKKIKIHLKIDTGMHRNGIDRKDIKNAFKIIKKRELFLKGVMTHFRSADELSSELFWQRENWREVKNEVKKICKEFSIPVPAFHSCNSAALFRLKEHEDDFVRCGIATYGYLETDPIFDPPKLKPVLSLWANKISSRVLKKGERVGYGGVFTAQKDMIISTYDIGYGDGFFRNDGKKELKTAEGKRILGRVSMDNISCEGESEEILVFEDAKRLAKHFNTISYEILTKLSSDIKRVVI